MDPIDQGAESESPTDNPADTSTDTATVKDTPPKDILERMGDRMEEVAKDITEDDTDPQAQKPTKGEKPDPKAKKDDKADDGKTEGKPEAKAEPDSVPMKAFQARVGKLTEQKRALQTELSGEKLNAAKLNAALTIATEELERYRQLAHEKGAFDEKDEQIRSHDVRERARAEKARVEQEHEEVTAGFSDMETREANREQLQGEIDAAVAAHQLVDPDVLITLLRKPANLSRPVLDVAAEYEAKILKAAGGAGGSVAPSGTQAVRPPSPKTVKAKASGNAAARRPANLDGMLARMDELAQHNT